MSPWGAPVLSVTKNDGFLRMYRLSSVENGYNQENFPLQRIDNLFNQLQDASCFQIIDHILGYHQLKVREYDIPKKVFITRYRHYEFLIMSFSLTYAPATLMDLMSNVFKTYLDLVFIVFTDDILVYSRNEEDHDIHNRIVLQTLNNKSYMPTSPTVSFG